MSDDQGRLQVVGAGMAASLARAAAEFGRLAKKAASNRGDFLTALAATIESTRAELEDCLYGFDSFDTLSFLRVAVSGRGTSVTSGRARPGLRDRRRRRT